MDSSFFRMKVLVERAPLLNRSCRETVNVPPLIFGGVLCLSSDVCIYFYQARSRLVSSMHKYCRTPMPLHFDVRWCAIISPRLSLFLLDCFLNPSCKLLKVSSVEKKREEVEVELVEEDEEGVGKSIYIQYMSSCDTNITSQVPSYLPLTSTGRRAS